MFKTQMKVIITKYFRVCLSETMLSKCLEHIPYRDRQREGVRIIFANKFGQEFETVITKHLKIMSSQSGGVYSQIEEGEVK